LVSCYELNCRNIHVRLQSTSASASGCVKRVRPPPPREDNVGHDYDDCRSVVTDDTGIAEIAPGVGELGQKRKRKGKANTSTNTKGKARPKPKSSAAATTSTRRCGCVCRCQASQTATQGATRQAAQAHLRCVLLPLGAGGAQTPNHGALRHLLARLRRCRPCLCHAGASHHPCPRWTLWR
jgi:hypothetical protein